MSIDQRVGVLRVVEVQLRTTVWDALCQQNLLCHYRLIAISELYFYWQGFQCPMWETPGEICIYCVNI